jgi:hypothetical protein
MSVFTLAGPRRPLRLVPLALTLGAPVLVYLVLTRGGTHAAGLLIAAVVATAFVVVVARHPAGAFIGLVLWQPISVIVLAALFRFGAPAQVVHGLGSVRDLVVIGVVAAAVLHRPHRPLDALDKTALALVVVVSAYVLLPYLAHGQFVVTTLNVRALAWRVDVEYLVLFVALRHVPMPARALRAVTVAVLTAASVVAVGAVVEFFASSAWNTFLVSWAQVPAYKNQVLHVASNPTDALVHGVVGSHAIIRVGSVLQSPLTLGFYLYVAWALSLRLLSGRRTRLAIAFTVGVVGLAILVTLTRSAVLGALVVAFACIGIAASRRSAGRVRIALLLLAAAAVFSPLAGSTTLGQRTSEAVSGTDISTNAHLTSLQAGFNTAVAHPFGLGLGTQPGIGTRFTVAGTVTAEDYYLGLADEVGLLSAVLFVATYLLLLRGLRRRSRSPGADGSFAGAVWAAGVGLAVGALFLHVWLDITVALTFWGAAAVALNASRPPATAGEPRR